jgi:uncharacterized protein (DUF2147 family)
MKTIASAFVVFSLAPAAIESASAAPDPTGIWMNDTGRGAVEIKQCGDALCGKVVWVKNAADADGCGKQILGNVAPVGGGRWDNGWIYSPEQVRKYDLELTPLANGTLRVTGYAGMKFLSKTMIWKRAPADLPLCGQVEAKADPVAPAPAPAPAAKPAAPEKSASDEKATAATSEPAPAAAEPAKPAAKPAAPADKDTAEAPADSKSSKDAAPEDKTASADDDNQGPDLSKALDGLGLGKVLTRTKSGKCKLDLPWVKLTLDCNQQ